jgi:hypothetical protein
VSRLSQSTQLLISLTRLFSFLFLFLLAAMILSQEDTTKTITKVLATKATQLNESSYFESCKWKRPTARKLVE